MQKLENMEAKEIIEKMKIEDRLLSENAVMKSVQKALIEMGYEPLGDEVQKIFGAIENTKTAYDVDSVVEQLEEMKNDTECKVYCYSFSCGKCENYDKAIDIVRAGGKEKR